MYTPLLLLGILATPSFSKPTLHPFGAHSVGSLSARGSANPYVVTNYTTACSNASSNAGSCTYSFNINFTSSTNPTEPSFATSCNGTTIQGNYVACAPIPDGSQVLTSETASNLTVRHIYETQNPWGQGGQPLTFTNQGSVDVGISPDFTITHDMTGVQAKEDAEE